MQKSGRIIIGGDLCPTPKNYDLFQNGEIEALFGEKILQLFDRADVSVCNIEGALTDCDVTIRKCGPKIKAPKATVEGIKKLGVSCVTLANNHITDYGKRGYLDTCETLKQNGIHCFGSGENENTICSFYTVTIKGITVTFYAVAETMFNRAGEEYPGVNLYDEYRVCRELQELKSHCDKLIVLYHGGPEFYRYPSEQLTRRFHRMADNGADMIVSQHSHAIGAYEIYRGAYLLYGQGDFLLARHENEYTAQGLLLEIELGDEDWKITPHLLTHTGGTVVYDPSQNLDAFYERSKKLSDKKMLAFEYQKFCDQKIQMYLEAFRGRNRIDRIVRKILSREKYLKYLKRQYKEDQLLRALHTIRCEEHSEQAIQGLLDLLEASGRGMHSREE